MNKNWLKKKLILNMSFKRQYRLRNVCFSTFTLTIGSTMLFTELYELIILKRGSLEPKTVDLKSVLNKGYCLWFLLGAWKLTFSRMCKSWDQRYSLWWKEVHWWLKTCRNAYTSGTNVMISNYLRNTVILTMWPSCPIRVALLPHSPKNNVFLDPS